ncbi:MAG: hypothetical protein IIB60_04200 [Planctomycetes bacterium]|nr:hypothetical protein [Planctomycetota bacterium]
MSLRLPWHSLPHKGGKDPIPVELRSTLPSLVSATTFPALNLVTLHPCVSPNS